MAFSLAWAFEASSGEGASKLKPRLLAAEPARRLQLNTKQVQEDLAFFAAKPHPFGSGRQQEIARWLEARLQALGLVVERQTFVATVPNPQLTTKADARARPATPLSLTYKGVNLGVRLSISAAPRCLCLLASHYDTKPLAHEAYLGANDSGSSSILLLHLASYLRAWQRVLPDAACDLLLVWFDGEEAVLPSWHAGEKTHPAHLLDHTYGSRHFVATQLRACGQEKCIQWPSPLSSEASPVLPVKAMILVDMVGSPGLVITEDLSSDAGLRALLRQGAEVLGLQKAVFSHKLAIEDDHTAFLKAGIASLNIIDFKNLDLWHRPQDTAERIAVASMEIAGKLALYVSLNAAQASP